VISFPSLPSRKQYPTSVIWAGRGENFLDSRRMVVIEQGPELATLEAGRW
jgi:hypothetical protein